MEEEAPRSSSRRRLWDGSEHNGTDHPVSDNRKEPPPSAAAAASTASDSTTSTPAWERSKENAAPLRRGRNVERSFGVVGHEAAGVVLSPRSTKRATTSLEAARQQTLQHYEALVQPSEVDNHAASTTTSADDATILRHWLSYIKFHQEAFAQDTYGQQQLLERCVRACWNRSSLANHVAFVRVCCTHAANSGSDAALDIFGHLHQQGIGVETALFWAAWAWTLESQQDFAGALRVLEHALHVARAQPAPILQRRYAQFQRRLARHVQQQQAQQQNQDMLDEDGEGGGRRRLGALSEEAFRRNQRGTTAAPALVRIPPSSNRQERPQLQLETFRDRSNQDRNRSSHQESNNNTSFSSSVFHIFADNDPSPRSSSPPWLRQRQRPESHAQQPRPLERQAEIRKENTLEAEQWNERGGLLSRFESSDRTAAAPPRPTPAFDIFTDAACEQEQQQQEQARQRHQHGLRQRLDERRLQSEREATDDISRRPSAAKGLRERRRPEEDVDAAAEESVSDSSSFLHRRTASSSSSGLRVVGPSILSTGSRLDQHKKTSTVSSRSTITQRMTCGFDRKLAAKDSHGHEGCFEEARAKARYYTTIREGEVENFNLLQQEEPPSNPNNDSAMSLEEEEEDSITMMDLSNATDNTGGTRNSLLALGRPPTHEHDRTASIGSSSQHGRHSNAAKNRGLVPHSLFSNNNNNNNNNNASLDASSAVAAAGLTVTPRNASTASSTVGSATGAGGGVTPTINTQFALRELSMMFSSPALAGLHNNQHQDSDDNSSVGNNQAGKRSNRSNASGSIVGPPAASTVSAAAQRNTVDVAEMEGRSAGNDGGETATLTSLVDLVGGMNLQNEPSAGLNPARRQILGPITTTDTQPSSDRPLLGQSANPGFAVYEEEDSVEQPRAAAPPPVAMAASFDIYQDSETGSVAAPTHHDAGDTATLSVFGDVIVQDGSEFLPVDATAEFGDISHIASMEDEPVE